MHLRKSRPDLHRPFRVPFGPIIPILGMLFALVMIAPLVLDIIGKAANGDPIPAILLTSYAAIGAAIYIFYGIRHSHLARGIQEPEDYAGTSPLAADLMGIRDGDA